MSKSKSANEDAIDLDKKEVKKESKKKKGNFFSNLFGRKKGANTNKTVVDNEKAVKVPERR